MLTRDGVRGLEILLTSASLEQVGKLLFLAVGFEATETVKAVMSHREGRVRRFEGSKRGGWKEKAMFVQARMGMFVVILVPPVLYSCEAWTVSELNYSLSRENVTQKETDRL